MNYEEIQRLILASDDDVKLHSSITPNMSSPIMGCLRDVHFPILKDIVKRTGVKNILEIGFNAGHSCLSWLLSSDDTKVVGLDIYYPEQSVRYLRENYTDRFFFVNVIRYHITYIKERERRKKILRYMRVPKDRPPFINVEKKLKGNYFTFVACYIRIIGEKH